VILALLALGLTVDVSVGFDGYYKVGRLLPVWLEAENRGPHFSGEFVIEWGPVTYRQEVALPSPSRKRFEFYVRAHDSRSRLEARLIDATGATVGTYELRLRALLPSERLIVVSDGTPVASTEGEVAVVSAPALARGWQAYDGVDELHAPASISSAQAEAIDQWRSSKDILLDTATVRRRLADVTSAHVADERRWRYLGAYLAAVALFCVVGPRVCRRMSVLFAMVFMIAITFAAAASVFGSLAFGGRVLPVTSVERISTNSGPTLTLWVMQPTSRRTVVVRAMSADVVIDAPPLPGYEVRFTADRTSSLAAPGALGESWSLVARSAVTLSDGPLLDLKRDD
jgi:hypothetical protein